MPKYDLEKPKRFRPKQKKGINQEKSNSINLSQLSQKDLNLLLKTQNRF